MSLAGKHRRVQELLGCKDEQELREAGVNSMFGVETSSGDLARLTSAHRHSETVCSSCLLYRRDGTPLRRAHHLPGA